MASNKEFWHKLLIQAGLTDQTPARTLARPATISRQVWPGRPAGRHCRRPGVLHRDAVGS
jgi:hypothetical protein